MLKDYNMKTSLRPPRPGEQGLLEKGGGGGLLDRALNLTLYNKSLSKLKLIIQTSFNILWQNKQIGFRSHFFGKKSYFQIKVGIGGGWLNSLIRVRAFTVKYYKMPLDKQLKIKENQRRVVA